MTTAMTQTGGMTPHCTFLDIMSYISKLIMPSGLLRQLDDVWLVPDMLVPDVQLDVTHIVVIHFLTLKQTSVELNSVITIVCND